MLKQKIAVVLGTLFLLTTLVLPGVVSAQNADQPATITLNGQKDIFYEGYDGAMTTMTFIAADGAADANGTINTSPFVQYAVPNYADDSADWPVTAFIGVIDLESAAAAWNLQVDAPASGQLDGAISGNVLDLGTDGLKVATTANEMNAAITLQDSSTATYNLVLDNTHATDAGHVYVWIPASSTYSFTDLDVSAGKNVATGTDFKDHTIYLNEVVSTTQDILSKGAAQVTGIFGTGVSYGLTIPGGTPGDTYTGNIVYTLA